MKFYYIGYELNGIKYPFFTQLGLPAFSFPKDSPNYHRNVLNVYWSKHVLMQHYKDMIRSSKGFPDALGTKMSKPYLGGRVYISRLNSKNAEFKVDIEEVIDYHNKYKDSGFMVRAKVLP